MNQNDIEAMIQRYTEAEMAVLDGKSVTFNGQQMTMENLSEIRQGRQEWERRLAALITRRRGHPGYALCIGYCCKRRRTCTYCRYWCSYALGCDWLTWTHHHR